MHYKLTFEDGSEAILAHHGVKGMHWGEWNEETKERYGIKDDDGGLSKLKVFRETSYTLPPGTKISRFTGLDEAKQGSTLSKPYFYGSHNEYDYNQYANMAKEGQLPSTTDVNLFGTKLSSKSGLVKLSSVDDITVARGKFVLDQALTEFKQLPSQDLLTSREFQDHFRRMGYDAIEDVHDQNDGYGTGVATHPLMVLNGDKLKTDYSGAYRRKRPPSWD